MDSNSSLKSQTSNGCEKGEREVLGQQCVPNFEEADPNESKCDGFTSNFHQWFNSLSIEEKCRATSICDASLAETLIHFRSLSKSKSTANDVIPPRNSESSDCDGRSNEEGQTDLITLEEIEEVYLGFSEKRRPMDTSTAETLPSDRVTTATLEKSDFKAPVETVPPKEKQVTSSTTDHEICKDRDISADFSSEQRKVPNEESSDASDVFRIQDKNGQSKLQGNLPTLNESTVKTVDNPLLSKVHVVFPAVLGALLRTARKDEDAKPSPMLLIPPAILKPEDLIRFPCCPPLDKGSENGELLSQVLRASATNDSVSLGTLLVAGMEVAAFNRFLLEQRKLTSDVKVTSHHSAPKPKPVLDEGSSEENWVTPPEREGGSDDNDTEETTSCFERTSVSLVPAVRGTRRQQRVAVPNTNQLGLVHVNEHLAKTEDNFPFDVFSLCDLVNQFASKKMLDDFQKLIGVDETQNFTPLLPFDAILGATMSFDEIDEKLGCLVSNAVENSTATPAAGAQAARFGLSKIDGHANSSSNAENEKSAEPQAPAVHTGSKKGKKKKKKKKKKGIGAGAGAGDASQGQNPQTQIEKPVVVPTQEATQPRGPIAHSEAQVANDSAVKNVAAAPVEPNATSLETTNEDTLNANSSESDRSWDSSNDVESTIDSQKVKSSVADGIQISRVEGGGPTWVVVPGSDSPNNHEEDNRDRDVAKDDDDDDEWETVESKSRSNRNRKANESRNGGQGSNNANINGTRKIKNKRTPATRKGNANRKMVRDILSSILDKVDAEVCKKKRLERKSSSEANSRSVAEKKRFLSSQADRRIHIHQQAPNHMRTERSQSLRDVRVGAQTMHPRRNNLNSNTKTPKQKEHVMIRQPPSHSSPSKVQKSGKIPADQGTATTSPETLSGNSANSQLTDADNDPDGIKRDRPLQQEGTAVVGDSSSVDADDTREIIENKSSDQSAHHVSPPPPLQTLLGPGNTNSASSSVASSLEAPHTSSHRHHHHHSSSGNENDVGYHLLDVCSRLSRDMGVFMMRRNQALAARRRERGALLTALQDTASRLWMGRSCHVEMYGSCATQLDLPSSDLDIVIRLGQDSGMAHGSGSPSGVEHISIRDFVPSSPVPSKAAHGLGHPHSAPSYGVYSLHGMHPTSSMNPYARASPSVNGERVLILAAEIERQPWAVQVKAISTASVPVVKMVADPSRLPGAVASVTSGENWIMQQHHMAAQAAVGLPLITSQGQAYPPHTPPPWRGADVMNGLFSLDITFEGPEHGGLGSTEIAAEFVRKECEGTGLPPERTPFVQVLMVLKELLAQRRLNEPFSGGLSSYALMLMLVAVVEERRLIRKEMERMEGHRRAVSSTTETTNSPPIDDMPRPTIAVEAPRLQRAESAPPRTASANQAQSKHPQAKPSLPGQQITTKEQGPKKMKYPPKETAAQKIGKGRSPAQTQQKRENPSSQPKAALAPASSWVSIARRSVAPPPSRGNGQTKPAVQSQTVAPGTKQPPSVTKPSSFAEAVSGKNSKAKEKPVVKQQGVKRGGSGKRQDTQAKSANSDQSQNPPSAASKAAVTTKQNKAEKKHIQGSQVVQPAQKVQQQSSESAPKSKPTQENVTKQQSGPSQPKLTQSQSSRFSPQSKSFVPLEWSLFPQGSNDIMEVLCSGDTTAGKLLMHFLLFYGEHFDSRTHSVDVRDTQQSEHIPHAGNLTLLHGSPFIQRRAKGSYHPVTGMLTVDPIVIIDPWAGGKETNVARSCYAWNSIRWHFAQCYMTLSSAIERSGTPTTTPAIESKSAGVAQGESHNPPIDMVSPLLEMLISF